MSSILLNHNQNHKVDKEHIYLFIGKLDMSMVWKQLEHYNHNNLLNT